MAKSKYAPALFEVMNRQKNTGKLGVPKWWRGGAQPAGGEPEGNDVAVSPVEPPGPGSVSVTPDPVSCSAPAGVRLAVPPAEAETDSTKFAHDDGSRMGPARLLDFRVASGRIYLSLGPVHAAVVCGGLLIVLIAAFQLGKGFAGPVAEKDGGLTLLDQKPNSSVLDQPAGGTNTPPSRAGVMVPGSEAQAGGDTPPAPPEQEVLKVGSHYVLFDTYPRDALESAEFVQKWLSSTHNIRTVLRERKGRYWLVGVDVFGDKTTCDRYAERIKALGPECSKALIKAGLPVYGLKDPMPFLIASEK